jgi:hypothetical protein
MTLQLDALPHLLQWLEVASAVARIDPAELGELIFRFLTPSHPEPAFDS